MRVLARFKGPSGNISVLEDPSTGARHYQEGGVTQSCVLAGGEADVTYVTLMAELLTGGERALLLGCGGGSLATMLQRRGSTVTIVERNPISFELARTFFWMPNCIECVTADMRDFVRAPPRTFDAIGIDVGGPRFSYDAALKPVTVAGVRRTLRDGGRIAINISCEAADDPMPGLIADRFSAEELEVWAFTESLENTEELNAVILASARQEVPSELEAIAGDYWSLARLTGRRRTSRQRQMAKVG